MIGLTREALPLEPLFGEGSYGRFSSKLNSRNLHFKTFISLGTALDIDTPNHLELAQSMGFKA